MYKANTIDMVSVSFLLGEAPLKLILILCDAAISYFLMPFMPLNLTFELSRTELGLLTMKDPALGLSCISPETFR